MFGFRMIKINRIYINEINKLLNNLNPTADNFDEQLTKLDALFLDALENVTGKINRKYISDLYIAYLEFKDELNE